MSGEQIEKIMQSNSVLNTIAATAGDITLLARLLSVAITSTTGAGQFPQMKYNLIETVQDLPSLIEVVNNVKFSYTAADNTEYSLTVEQNIDGQLRTFTAKLSDSGTGATNASIGTALADKFTDNGFDVTATHTGADAFIIIVGIAGNPLFVGISGTNVTAAVNLASVPTVASNTTADPTVITTSAPHGLVVGNTITLTSGDEAKIVSGTYRVRSIPLTTTMTLEQVDTRVTLGGTSTTTATYTIDAQESRGDGTTLASAGIEGATAGTLYNTYIFKFGTETPGSSNTVSKSGGNEHTLYVAEGAPSANFTAFDDRMREHMNAFVAAGTTSDPEAIKVANI